MVNFVQFLDNHILTPIQIKNRRELIIMCNSVLIIDFYQKIDT